MKRTVATYLVTALCYCAVVFIGSTPHRLQWAGWLFVIGAWIDTILLVSQRKD